MNAQFWRNVSRATLPLLPRPQLLQGASRQKIAAPSIITKKTIIPASHFWLSTKRQQHSLATAPLSSQPSILKPTDTAANESNFKKQLFKPVAFYSLIPIPRERVLVLRDMIEKRLSELGVVGRIYLAPEEGIGGINSQMAVPLTQMASIKQFFNDLHGDLGPLSFTEGLENLREPCFRKLRVMIKKNLVGVKHSIQASDLVDPSAHHLDPASWHKELSEKGNNAFLVDMRNHYEYDMGHFEHAVKLDVDTFREGLDELQNMVKNQPDKTLYMYCTGGIRCDVTASYLQKNDIHDFKMLQGGITAYGNYIHSLPKNADKDDTKGSLFRGKNFSFDDRRGERITDDVLTRCHKCGQPCDTLHNCANTRCHLLFVQCEACRQAMNNTCSDTCNDVLAGKKTWDMEYNYHRQIRPVASSS